jgi:hypothetical protein
MEAHFLATEGHSEALEANFEALGLIGSPGGSLKNQRGSLALNNFLVFFISAHFWEI